MKKHEIKCQKCKGWMAFEKFYGPNDVFFGWHCTMCGNIIDPVILLHRISQDADIAIPETEEKVISLIILVQIRFLKKDILDSRKHDKALFPLRGLKTGVNRLPLRRMGG